MFYARAIIKSLKMRKILLSATASLFLWTTVCNATSPTGPTFWFQCKEKFREIALGQAFIPEWEKLPGRHKFRPRRGRLVEKGSDDDVILGSLDLELPNPVYRIDNDEGRNARIFRTETKNGGPVVLKVFREHAVDQLDMDIINFNVVEQISKESGINWIIPKRHKIAEGVMQVESRVGRTIEDLLKDKKIKSSMKAELLERYNSVVSQFAEAFTKKYPDVRRVLNRALFGEGVYSFQSIPFSSQNGPISDAMIIIKPDNVLVDSVTGELILIDPF